MSYTNSIEDASGTDSFSVFDSKTTGHEYHSRRLSMCNGCVDVRSITKSIVALEIIKLHVDGALHLDDRLDNFFTETIDTALASVTLDELLTHTSGIQDKSFFSQSVAYDPADDFAILYAPSECTRASSFAHAESDVCDTLNPFKWSIQHTPDPTVRGTFWYSNAGYQILACVIERVTGEQIHIACRNDLWDGWGGMMRWYRTKGVPLGQAGLCVRAGALSELGKRLLSDPLLQKVRDIAWSPTTLRVPNESRFNRMNSYGRGFWLNASDDGTVNEVLGHGSQSNYWYFDLAGRRCGYTRLHLSGTEAGDSLWEYGDDWDESITNLRELHL